MERVLIMVLCATVLIYPPIVFELKLTYVQFKRRVQRHLCKCCGRRDLAWIWEGRDNHEGWNLPVQSRELQEAA